MDTTKKYKIQIKTITPVHIGSGESYGSSAYVKNEKKGKKGPIRVINKIDLPKYYLSLDDDKKDELIFGLSTEGFALESFDDKISNKFVTYFSYDRCKENIKSKYEILETIKSFDEMYIPGSSFKGSIKTALVYNSINKDDIPNIVDNIIYRNRRGELKIGNDDKFMDNLFSSGTGRNNPQYNISKFLHVSDSSTIKNPAIYDVISVMAKSDGNNEFHKKYGNVVRTYLETIGSGKILESNIMTNYNSEIYSRLNLDDKSQFLDINFIKESIYEFSKRLIDYEIEFSKKYSIKYLKKFYENIKKDNSLENPLLKIGSGSGFLATTIGLKVKEYDEYEFDDYINKLADLTNGTNYPFEYPKSRRIIAKGAKPLGWVQLSFEDD